MSTMHGTSVGGKAKTFTAWITTSALTQGILEVVGAQSPSWPNNFVYVHPVTGRERWVLGENKGWHRTRESAVAKAELQRVNRIKRLRKELARLESLQFAVEELKRLEAAGT